jgi:hypothetical protein
MSDFKIYVENKFKTSKRRIVVHNNSDSSDTTIDWPVEGGLAQRREFTISQATGTDSENFLLITVLEGDVVGKPCRVNFPAQGKLSFTPLPGTAITIKPTTDGPALVFPGGPPAFPLKITRPPKGIISSQDPDNVTVGDDGEGG